MCRAIPGTVCRRAAIRCRRCTAIFRGRSWISGIRLSSTAGASRLSRLYRGARRPCGCPVRNGCRLNLRRYTREIACGDRLYTIFLGRNGRRAMRPRRVRAIVRFLHSRGNFADMANRYKTACQPLFRGGKRCTCTRLSPQPQVPLRECGHAELPHVTGVASPGSTGAMTRVGRYFR